jgi:hypothetical protein
MNLTNLLVFTRAMIPGAKVDVIDDPTVTIVLNLAAVDIAATLQCLKGNKKFNVTAGIGEYVLSTVIPDYLCVDKPGLWWYNGVRWTKIFPRTLKWLDDNFPNWRDMDSGTPRYYSIDGDILTVVPKPLTAVVDGFWLYYGKKPIDMAGGDTFPFTGSAVEMPHLSIFDFALMYYAKWKLDPILNKDADANLSMQEYLREREEKRIVFYRRADISASGAAQMNMR